MADSAYSYQLRVDRNLPRAFVQAAHRVYLLLMKAPTITHGLKTIGLGQGMIPGILVIGAVCWYLGDENRRQQILDALFG